MEEMPYDPNYVIWSSFLSSCKIYGDVELGREAADQLIKMEPGSAAPYLTLAHIYARKALWNEVAEVRRLMQQRRITEPAGWSWVDDSTIFVRTLKSDVDVVNVLITLYVKCGDANTARLVFDKMPQHHPVSFHDSAFPTLAFHLDHTWNQDGFQPNLEIHLLPLLSMKPEDTSLEFNSRDLLFCLKDVIFLPPFVAIPVRPRPGVWEYVHNNVSDLSVEQLSISEYLCFKEELVDGKINDNLYWSLTLSHLMPHFLAHSTSHTLAMVSNFLIATFHQLCFATKIPCLISSELTNTRAIL